MPFAKLITKSPLPLSWLIAAASAFVGMIFVLLAWYLELEYHIMPISPDAVFAMHRNLLAVWVIDLAPLVMGVYGYLTGLVLEKFQNRLSERVHNESKLVALIENMANGIIVINARGSIQHINHAASRIFGYSEQELIGRNVAILMPKDVGEMHDQYIANYFNTDIAKILDIRREVEAVRSNGEVFPLELKVSKLEFQGGQFFIGSVSDLSEVKSLELQLYQARKLEAIGQLAAGIAHEINTPIQYIGDNLRALEESFNDLIALLNEYRECIKQAVPACRDAMAAAENRHSADYIIDDTPKAIRQSLEGTERVRNIVRAMKDFSHIDRSQISRININEAIKNTLTIAHNEYKYLADIVTDFSELPSVECYASDLNGVFLNLIVNAAHAIEAKGAGRGRISISTKVDGYEVEIAISDTGAGIDKKISQRIYDPFFTTKEVGKGTGQGLHIAHQVISKHNGKIWFSSEANQGTTFFIRLPLRLAQVT
ncbi:MAG: hypothetical protein CTY34_00800 [Methylobacter sp.]|nr:MAG: hypothetical protein CTY34_00800 [Methylobacter sp.]PPD19493.1 MAG: hypothetical protein CTY24_10740 [Methylobacter sp.]PPD35324.1 MAG: hypothetical protein CTY18_06605 [Methylomonas sp.]